MKLFSQIFAWYQSTSDVWWRRGCPFIPSDDSSVSVTARSFHQTILRGPFALEILPVHSRRSFTGDITSYHPSDPIHATSFLIIPVNSSRRSSPGDIISYHHRDPLPVTSFLIILVILSRLFSPSDNTFLSSLRSSPGDNTFSQRPQQPANRSLITHPTLPTLKSHWSSHQIWSDFSPTLCYPSPNNVADEPLVSIHCFLIMDPNLISRKYITTVLYIGFRLWPLREWFTEREVDVLNKLKAKQKGLCSFNIQPA